MAITDGYATLDEVKARLDLSTTTHDAALERIVEAASRQIDDWCRRHFYQREDQTRTYTAESPAWLPIDDLVTLDTLATIDTAGLYTTIWPATSTLLEPANAALVGAPYRLLRVAPVAGYAFPSARAGIQVTGTFGWPVLPAAVKEATLLQTQRLFKRKDAPFGIYGAPGIGQLRVLGEMDPDVKSLLKPYRRPAPVV